MNKQSLRATAHETLIAATKDQQTVTPQGEVVGTNMPHGMVFQPRAVHVDDRGKLVEMFDTRNPWHPAPLVSVYHVTIRPGVVKGWALHETHEDRYALIVGAMDVVTYDIRNDSPTYGQIHRITLSEENPGVLTIPTYVWHADVNVTTSDVVLANMPTKGYDYENPNKFRLPIDTPLIPYDFKGYRGY